MITNNKTKGVLLMLIASVIFCVMAGLVRAAGDIDSYTTTFYRFAIGLAILCIGAVSGIIRLRFNNHKLLLLRGLTGGISIFIFFMAIAKLGMGKGTIIISTNVIFACIFGVIFLKEKISLPESAAIAVAFAGIYLLSTKNGTSVFAAASFGKYETIALFGAAVSGLAIICIRKLHQTDSSYAIFFAQCIIGTWLMLVPAGISHSAFDSQAMLLLLAIGFTASVAQLLMTQSFRYLPVKTASILMMLGPVINFFAGMALFNETADIKTVTGAAMVIVASVFVATTRDSKPVEAAAD